MADIWDVARLAGVSKSTVSRVITEKGSVKQSTKEIVKRAMAELNYTPSYFAQGIRTGKTKVIAIVCPDPTNIFYKEMIACVEDFALESGYMVIICYTNRSKSRELLYLSQLQNRNIDGVIFCTYFYAPEHLEYLLNLSKEMPMVFMDHVFEGRDDVSVVITEGVRSNQRVVEYLVNKGCKKIAYLYIPDISVVNHRYEGYLKGLESCGLKFDEELIYKARHDEKKKSYFEMGIDGMKHIMQSGKSPDAVIASIDILAIGAMQYLQEINVKIPDEIKVVGYDNVEMSQIIKPRLSTIAQPIRTLSREATRILLRKMNEDNNYNQYIVLDPEFIERESS